MTDGAAVGRGKVILFGEHAVVYGVPAIAASLARGVTATAAAHDGGDVLEIPTWSRTVTTDTAGEPLGQAFAALRALHPAKPSVRVVAEVGLPAGAGLGCSAALGVAVLRAVDAVFGITRSDDDAAHESLRWERVFHGNPSGVDSAMAAGSGVAVFEKGKPLVKLALPGPLTLVVGNSGEPSSTKAMVSSVAAQQERDPVAMRAKWDGITTIVTKARAALTAGDARTVGQLMDDNDQILAGLGLATAKLTAMCDVARRAGALGAKITGAGGGGCCIALSPDSETGARIAEEMGALGKEAFVTEIGP